MAENPKKLKYIQKFPDSYIKGLELELYQLSDFYAINFQQPLADALAVVPVGVGAMEAGAKVELEMFRWPEGRTREESVDGR